MRVGPGATIVIALVFLGSALTCSGGREDEKAVASKAILRRLMVAEEFYHSYWRNAHPATLELVIDGGYVPSPSVPDLSTILHEGAVRSPFGPAPSGAPDYWWNESHFPEGVAVLAFDRAMYESSSRYVAVGGGVVSLMEKSLFEAMVILRDVALSVDPHDTDALAKLSLESILADIPKDAEFAKLEKSGRLRSPFGPANDGGPDYALFRDPWNEPHLVIYDRAMWLEPRMKFVAVLHTPFGVRFLSKWSFANDLGRAPDGIPPLDDLPTQKESLKVRFSPDSWRIWTTRP